MGHFHCERGLPGRLDARCLEPLDRPPQVRLPPGPAMGNQEELLA